ncbi:MAG: hypothetical protein CL508_05160 [Actinobacteria bacterium]|nr:hypothetical protein [Actinomycetota bacterium]|tara:strand:- start:6381 stop:7367 length:987 start_codon:yes stop_codon:yes gene_type:complete
MELTEELIIHIEDLEGFKEKAYYDLNGTLTIGFGHTNATETFDFKEGDVIDREKALEILQLDLNHARETVERLIKNSPNVSLEDYSQSELDYATLIYFNRPWTLRNLEGEVGTYDGLELIAEGNLDAIIEDQEEKIKRKYDGEIPKFLQTRLTKEKNYTVLEDPPPPPPTDDDTEGVTLYDEEGKGIIVDPSIVDDLLNLTPTKYYLESPTKYTGNYAGSNYEEDEGNTDYPVDEFKFVGTELITPEATKEVWAKVLRKLYGVNNPFEDEVTVWKNNMDKERVANAPLSQRFGNVFRGLGGRIKTHINEKIDAQLDFMEHVSSQGKEE